MTSSLIQTLMIYPAVRSLVMHTRGRAVWGNHSNWPSYGCLILYQGIMISLCVVSSVEDHTRFCRVLPHLRFRYMTLWDPVTCSLSKPAGCETPHSLVTLSHLREAIEYQLGTHHTAVAWSVRVVASHGSSSEYASPRISLLDRSSKSGSVNWSPFFLCFFDLESVSPEHFEEVPGISCN